MPFDLLNNDSVTFLSRCQRIVKVDVSSEIRCVARSHKNRVSNVYRIYALSLHIFCDTKNVEFTGVAWLSQNS